MSSKNGRPHRNTLAVCIIARDEGELLPLCLDSLYYDRDGERVPIWDELVVGIDDRTTDSTPDIVKAHGGKVVYYHWPESDLERDFAGARNSVEEATSCDYIYVQDADEKLMVGHQVLLDVVREGRLASVRPVIVFTRDEFGAKQIAYPRQDVLHRRTTHTWKGRLHEWTEGPLGEVRNDIEVEQMARPGGDRPHGDTFESLRGNFQTSPDNPWHERHMFYLLREHAGMPGHEQEAIALAEALLKHAPSVSPLQRSHACLIAGECSGRIGEPTAAHRWYLEAMEHWAAWAEPYYAMGVFCFEIAQRQMQDGAPPDVCKALYNEAVGFLYAACQQDAPAYFVDFTVYSWRRYHALSVALARVGRLGESHIWMQRAVGGCPDNEELKDQLKAIEEAMPVADREAVTA